MPWIRYERSCFWLSATSQLHMSVATASLPQNLGFLLTRFIRSEDGTVLAVGTVRAASDCSVAS